MTPTQQDAPAAALDASMTRSVEAILFTSERPVSARRIAEALGLIAPQDAVDQQESSDPAQPAVQSGDTAPADKPEVVVRRSRKSPRDNDASAALKTIEAAIAALNDDYARTGRTFRIEPVSGGFRVMTRPELAPVLTAFHRAAPSQRLSRAAVETLSIIAYRQPVTRAQLEAIRGVSCGEVLRSLLERRLVTIKGRAEELGRPILYGTTREFLDAFGLASLKDLPTPAEIAIA